MAKKKSFVIVENGKNYSANESNTFFELFIYLKKNIIFKSLNICKIEEIKFIFLYFINENYWRHKKFSFFYLFIYLLLLLNLILFKKSLVNIEKIKVNI